MDIFSQIALCAFSIGGYYFIKREPIYAYIIFILQNIIAFAITGQWYMIINVLACIYFGQKLANDYGK